MIKIRCMTIDDLPLGLGLSRQAGWNQTESDWRRFMSMEPEGCFVAEFNGSSVGTTTTCVFGHQVAWIAMVLVDKEVRGRGIGTGLLKHALDYLKERKAGTVRLDATPAGRPIYEKLGFVPEYELARFEGMVQRPPQAAPVSEAEAKVFSDLIEFDRRMTGTDRAKMLGRLFEEFPEHIRIVRQGNDVAGFITMRPGANAIQAGPCIATANAGPSLLSDALNRCLGKPVFVDIPLDNVQAVKIAESSGLRVQRCFTRMCMGERINEWRGRPGLGGEAVPALPTGKMPAPLQGQDALATAIWSSSGPEKG